MSMKRTCAISSRKSDLVSADIRGLSAKNLRVWSENQKSNPHSRMLQSLRKDSAQQANRRVSGITASSWGRRSRFTSAPGKIECMQTSRQQRDSDNEDRK